MRGIVGRSWLWGSLALIGSGCAGQSPPLDFRVLDSNDSGFISREEAVVQPQLNAGFERADLDRDGRVGMAEFAVFEPRPEAAPIQALDDASR